MCYEEGMHVLKAGGKRTVKKKTILVLPGEVP